MLHYWDASWPLIVEQCPCDIHFINWMEARKLRDSAIFHFGTGEHHVIAKHMARDPRGNALLGVTASKNEYQTYIDLVIAEPDVARLYNTVFCDIYLLDAKLLPMFDAVTLFHLCEFWSEKNAAYGAMTDRQLAELMLSRTKSGGHVLFYTGSFAFDDARPIADALEKEGRLIREADHESLRVYRKP